MPSACRQHRHQEWLKFLKKIDRETPPELDLHLIVDNYATHKHPKVQRWLKRNKRFHMHFTPTSSSWLNLVERWFRNITDQRIRRGVFKSVAQLEQAICEYIENITTPILKVSRLDGQSRCDFGKSPPRPRGTE